MDISRRRIKMAELLSAAGAAAMGGGFALMLYRWIHDWSAILFAAGLVAHATGMYRKRSLERRGGTTPSTWEEWLYWGCWVGLLAILAWLVLRQLVGNIS